MIPFASTFAFIKSIDLKVVKRNIRTHLINMGIQNGFFMKYL